MKCDHCNKEKDSVQWIPNPFLEDVGNDILYEWICEECYGELCDDI